MEQNRLHDNGTTSLVTALRQRLLIASNDRRKIELYVCHLPEIIVADPAAAAALADEAYYLAVLRGGKSERMEILRHRASANIQLGNLSKAVADLGEAYEICESIHDYGNVDTRRTDLISLALMLGKVLLQLDDYQKALLWYRKALDVCVPKRDASHARALLELGTLYRRVGEYNRATNKLFEALSIAEEIGPSTDISAILLALGSTFELIGDDESAHEFHTRALAQSADTGDHRAEVQALTHLASIHRRSGNNAKALELALKSHAVYELLADRFGAAEALLEIGDIHEEMAMTDVAFDFHRKAYASLPANSGNALRLPILVRAGRLHLRNNEIEAAHLVLKWALDIATEINDRPMQCAIHQSLVTVTETLGHIEDALDHQKCLGTLRETLAGDEQRRAIAELQVRFDLERAERELESTRQRAIGLEKAVDEKKAELTALAVSLVEKEKTLERLQVKVGRLRVAGGAEGDALVAEIINDINQKRSPAEDWKRFEIELNRIHPNFTQDLLARAKTLTQTELRICYLTKLNHSSKDIASLMGTSVRTVETQRHSIRKKLGLSSTTNFAAFIASL